MKTRFTAGLALPVLMLACNPSLEEEPQGRAEANQTTADGGGAVADAGGSAIPADELAARLETEFTAQGVMGRDLLEWQLDNLPVRRAASDEIDFKLPEQFAPSFWVRGAGLDVTLLRSPLSTASIGDGRIAPGTYACAEYQGVVKVANGTPQEASPFAPAQPSAAETLTSSEGATCQVTITKAYREPSMSVVVGPRWITVGTVEATLKDAGGQAHALRAAFVVAQRPF